MRILFVGVLDIDWSTNCAMKRELEVLGHTVVPFNYRTVTSNFSSTNVFSDTFLDKLLDRGTSFLRSARLSLNIGWYYRRKGRKEMNHLLLETAKKGAFDLVFLSKTDAVDYDLLPEINKYVSIWYFFMDPMDQAMRINAGAYVKRAIWASATFFDVAEYFRKIGAQAFWIPQG